MSDHGKSIKTLAHEALMNSFSYEDSSQQSFTKGYEIGFSVCLSRAERAESALQDIERILASMTQLGSMKYVAALKVFEDSFVVIAGICESAQKKARNQ